MRILLLFCLLPFIAQAQSNYIFTMKAHQVKSVKLGGGDHIDYYYQDGLITAISDVDGTKETSYYYYSANERIDSLIVHTSTEGNATVSRDIHEYNAQSQLIRTLKQENQLSESIQVDSFFYNELGQMSQCLKYKNQLGIEFGFRNAESIQLFNASSYEYNQDGQLAVEYSSISILPYELRYFYNKQGQKTRTVHIFNTNTDKQEAAGDRFKTVSEYEYNEKGLLARVSVSSAIIKPNGKVEEIPGNVRQKRKYSYYDNI